MTKEDAMLHMILRREELKHSVGDLDEDIKAFDMVIEALEQEPIFDKILDKAKQEIRYGENKAYNADFTMGCEYAISVIERMFEEQVSTEKTGQWIDVEGYEGLLCKCSNCCKDGERYKHRTHQSKTNFCPDCGAKMGVEE